MLYTSNVYRNYISIKMLLFHPSKKKKKRKPRQWTWWWTLVTMGTVGRNKKSDGGTARLNPTFPRTISSCRQTRGWAYQITSHRSRRLYASLSELLFTHTHTHPPHNIQIDWVKAEHMAQYFLMDFILNSELTIWEFYINDNFSVYSFLIFQVVEMSGKMEKIQLCTELETNLKHYTLILIQVS